MVFYYDIFYVIVMVIAAGIGVLIGLSRRTWRGMVSWITTILAGVLTFVGISAAIRYALGSHLPTIAGAFSVPEKIINIAAGNEGISAILTIVLGGIAGPLLFGIVFFILKLILLIPSLIVKSIIKKKESDGYRKNGWHKLGGALFGMTSAVLIMFALTFPFNALISTANDVMNGISPETIDMVYEKIPDLYDVKKLISGKRVENPAFSFGTRKLVGLFSRAEYKGHDNDANQTLSQTMRMIDTAAQYLGDGKIDIKTDKGVDALASALKDIIKISTENRMYASVLIDFGSEAAGDLVTKGNYADLIELTEYTQSWFIKLLKIAAGTGDRAEELREGGDEAFEQELNKYNAIIDDLAKVLKSVKGNFSDVSTLFANLDVQAVGGIFEKINQTALLKGQVEEVIDVIFDFDQIKNILPNPDTLKDSLKKALAKGDGSFANTLDAAKRAAVIAVQLSSEETDTEEIADQIGWLAENMNEELAETVKSAVSSSAFVAAMPEATASIISDAVGTLCDKLAEQEKLTGEESKKESEALVMLYNIGTEVSKGNLNDGIFEGKIPDADSVIDTIAGSGIISGIIKDMNYDENGKLTDNPLGVSVTLSDSDRNSVESALKSYSEKNPDADKTLLSAIANLFGITF